MAEGRLCAFRRPILLHQVKARKRHIQTRALGILEQHEFGVAVALINLLQPVILPDAVFHMDHVVTNLEIAKIGKECRDLGFLPLRTRNHRL